VLLLVSNQGELRSFLPLKSSKTQFPWQKLLSERFGTMLLWPQKLFTSAWNCLNSPEHCMLQADEVEALAWVTQRNHALAGGTAVSAANAETLPWTKLSQEPQHLQNHSTTFPLAVPTLGLEIPNLEDFSSKSDGSTESPSDCPSNMDDGGTEFEDLDIMLDVCFP
jgi:hypothetical protein